MSYLRNGWNWVHLTGSSSVMFILSLIFLNKTGIIVTAILGFLWELGDEIYKRYGNGNLDWLFDPVGFDFRDLIIDYLGIFSAELILIYSGVL